jgi:hypothetical protein
MKWAGHVARMRDRRDVYKILVERYNTVRSESRCALRLRYVELIKWVQACVDVRGHHFQQLL